MNGVSQKVREVVGDLESNPTGVLNDLKTSRWRFEAGPPTDRRELGWYYVDSSNGKVYENKIGIYEDTGYTFAGGGGGGITGADNLGGPGTIGIFSGEDISGTILEFKNVVSDRTRVDPNIEKNIIIRDDGDDINFTITRGLNQVNNATVTGSQLYKEVSYDTENIGTLLLKTIVSSDEPDGSEFSKLLIDEGSGDTLDFKPYKCVNTLSNADGGSGGLVKVSTFSGDGTNRQDVPIKNIKVGSGLALVENVDDITLSLNASTPPSYYYQYQSGETYSIQNAPNQYYNLPLFTVNAIKTDDWLGVENNGGSSYWQYLGDSGVVYRLTYSIQAAATMVAGERYKFLFRIGTGPSGGGAPIPLSSCTFAVPDQTVPTISLHEGSASTSFLFSATQNELYTFQGRADSISQRNISISEINISITRA